ncbi:MAG: type II toxin-antitoxin system PemK/MazF family toxin [Chloroflexi bacterium]|nr:type II toxin-antitoxin system PemK/MazF family toxin [Chloroflexota bacterium]
MSALQWAVVEADLDPVQGSEQKGLRPVLIVSNEEFNQAVSNVTVLPLTSARRRLYPSEVLLPVRKAGQPLESIVMAHQIRTISKRRLRGFLGYLEDSLLRQAVRDAISEHLDLD